MSDQPVLSTQVPPDSPTGTDPVVAKLEWQGYAVTVYRSLNSGDMVFDIDTPLDYGDSITVTINDDGVYP